jgi:lysophospholipase L1-like esterase
MMRAAVRLGKLVLLLWFVTWAGFTAARLVPPLVESAIADERAVPFQTESRQKNMLVVGDSTAYGIGAYHPEDSTAGRVSRSLDLGVENRSRSGARTREMVQQLDRARESHYDLILMQTGANDVMKFSSIEETGRELDAALARARELSDRVVLLTAGDIGSAPIWPALLGDVYTERTKALRAIFIDVAARHGVEYVDVFIEPDPFSADVERYYTPDTMHPSSDGYALWAERILASIHARWPEL